MSSAEWKDREEKAWDALIAACFLKGLSDPNADDDPGLLDDEDKKVLAEIDDDFIDGISSRFLSGETTRASDPVEEPHPGFNVTPGMREVAGSVPFGHEIIALHRGDELLTPEAIEEMEEQARKLLEREEGG